jgi:hypothetical protein
MSHPAFQKFPFSKQLRQVSNTQLLHTCKVRNIILLLLSCKVLYSTQFQLIYEVWILRSSWSFFAHLLEFQQALNAEICTICTICRRGKAHETETFSNCCSFVTALVFIIFYVFLFLSTHTWWYFVRIPSVDASLQCPIYWLLKTCCCCKVLLSIFRWNMNYYILSVRFQKKPLYYTSPNPFC